MLLIGNERLFGCDEEVVPVDEHHRAPGKTFCLGCNERYVYTLERVAHAQVDDTCICLQRIRESMQLHRFDDRFFREVASRNVFVRKKLEFCSALQPMVSISGEIGSSQ